MDYELVCYSSLKEKSILKKKIIITFKSIVCVCYHFFKTQNLKTVSNDKLLRSAPPKIVFFFK